MLSSRGLLSLFLGLKIIMVLVFLPGTTFAEFDVRDFDFDNISETDSGDPVSSLGPDTTEEEFEKIGLDAIPQKFDEKGSLGVKEEFEGIPPSELGVSASDWKIAEEYKNEVSEPEYREFEDNEFSWPQEPGDPGYVETVSGYGLWREMRDGAILFDVPITLLEIATDFYTTPVDALPITLYPSDEYGPIDPEPPGMTSFIPGYDPIKGFVERRQDAYSEPEPKPEKDPEPEPEKEPDTKPDSEICLLDDCDRSSFLDSEYCMRHRREHDKSSQDADREPSKETDQEPSRGTESDTEPAPTPEPIPEVDLDGCLNPNCDCGGRAVGCSGFY